MPPMPEEDLAAEVLKATQNVTAVDKPSVTIPLSVSFAFLRHAMMKIAYRARVSLARRVLIWKTRPPLRYALPSARRT